MPVTAKVAQPAVFPGAEQVAGGHHKKDQAYPEEDVRTVPGMQQPYSHQGERNDGCKRCSQGNAMQVFCHDYSGTQRHGKPQERYIPEKHGSAALRPM